MTRGILIEAFESEDLLNIITPKLRSRRHPDRRTHQYAAMPIRFDAAGKLEVLLLTSRGTGRWIIPKGWPMRKLGPGAAAAREAYEEAGLEGTICPNSAIGHYHYAKALEASDLLIRVEVFLLRVDRQLETWPERSQRETRWFSPEDAAALVAEPELASLLRRTREIMASMRPDAA